MKSETREILEVLSCYFEKMTAIRKEESSFAETWINRLVIVLFPVTAILLFLPFRTGNLIGVATMAAFLIFGAIGTFRNARYLLSVFRKPFRDFAIGAEQAIQVRDDVVRKLSDFSPESLELVRSAMERNQGPIKARLVIFLGPVEKTGLLPGAIALFYSATKIFNGTSTFPTIVISEFVVAAYGIAFLGFRLLEQMSVTTSCLQEAIERSRRKAVLLGEHQPSHTKAAEIRELVREE